MTIPAVALGGILAAVAAAGTLAGVLIGEMTSRRGGRRFPVDTDVCTISVEVVGIDEAAAKLDGLRAKANEVVEAMLRVEDIAMRLPGSR